MDTLYDRTDRFEKIAACESETLVDLADGILDGERALDVLQEPATQLIMMRARDPVEERPFNLGEVVVTVAEVALDGAKGFAMVAGKDERAALAGAVVDAAVAGDHERGEAIGERLAACAASSEADRREEWAHSRETAVEFNTVEEDV